jgi:hypothetical protein
VATSLNNMASLYYAQGQYATAELLYQRALALAIYEDSGIGPPQRGDMPVRSGILTLPIRQNSRHISLIFAIIY